MRPARSPIRFRFPIRRPARTLARLCAGERGSTVIEYALVASLIAVALGGAFMSLGDEVETRYNDVDSQYRAANR